MAGGAPTLQFHKSFLNRSTVSPARDSRREASASLNRHFYFPNVRRGQRLIDRREIFTNGIANIFHRFLFGRALRPASWKRRTAHGIAFLGFLQQDGVAQTHRRILAHGIQKRTAKGIDSGTATKETRRLSDAATARALGESCSRRWRDTR